MCDMRIVFHCLCACMYGGIMREIRVLITRTVKNLFFEYKTNHKKNHHPHHNMNINYNNHLHIL